MSVTRSLFSKVVPLGALVMAMAAPAQAQSTSAVEVSAGYNLLKVEDTIMPAGWYAEASGKLTPMFAAVGQLTANYKTVEQEGVSVDTKLATFMGGVRLNASTINGSFFPFAQALFGFARASGTVNVPGSPVEDSRTDPALQLGGGVKFFPGVIGVQAGADYLRIFSDPGADSVRFAAGVLVGF